MASWVMAFCGVQRRRGDQLITIQGKHRRRGSRGLVVKHSDWSRPDLMTVTAGAANLSGAHNPNEQDHQCKAVISAAEQTRQRL